MPQLNKFCFGQLTWVTEHKNGRWNVPSLWCLNIEASRVLLGAERCDLSTKGA